MPHLGSLKISTKRTVQHVKGMRFPEVGHMMTLCEFPQSSTGVKYFEKQSLVETARLYKENKITLAEEFSPDQSMLPCKMDLTLENS